jgi:hypothetical protein
MSLLLVTDYCSRLTENWSLSTSSFLLPLLSSFLFPPSSFIVLLFPSCYFVPFVFEASSVLPPPSLHFPPSSFLFPPSSFLFPLSYFSLRSSLLFLLSPFSCP